MYSSFNPHTHAGCDCIYNCACGYGYVSIHTPTQGVTELVKRIPSVKQFQSTHPRRVWLRLILLLILVSRFQSTHPRRVWPSARSFLIFIPGFNPHTHAGCDSCILSYWTNNWCFNPHTHAGCDLNLLLWMICLMFQSTHPRRVWPYNSTPSTSGVSFQSTHPRRVWRLIRPILILIVSFNPHTHAGCDLWTYYYLWLWCCFNPHTHAGCDKTNQTSIDINRVSIHTPTQGVTMFIIKTGIEYEFQSTHPRRVWQSV